MEVFHFLQLSAILGNRSVYKSSIKQLFKSNYRDVLDAQQGEEQTIGETSTAFMGRGSRAEN